ncbi:MAG TPA: amino acid adenylation domain-containing protein, partial [Blastocatellia bacterium]
VGKLEIGEVEMEAMVVETGTSKFDLTMSLEEVGGRIAGSLQYNTDIFDRQTIIRMVGHYKALLRESVRHAERPIAQLPMLTNTEQQQLLVEWSGVQPARVEDAQPAHQVTKCVHELFEANAEMMPDAIAVTSEEGSLTFAALNGWANRLARHLQSLGVGPDVSVGIFVEPSIEMMIGVLGILKAGGNYVPIDPVFPRDRINYILEDSRVPALLTLSAMKERFTADRIEVLYLDEIAELVGGYDDSNLPNRARLEDRAYTIYTSGSTGRPKGVMVEHRQIVNYLSSVTRRFDLKRGAQYAMLQPLAVDSCNTVLMPSMCAGGTLHVMPRDRAIDPFVVLDYFQRHYIDVLKIAPSHLASLVDACPTSDLLPRAALALGGEGSHWDWVRSTLQPIAPADSTFFIHYGPTEATVGMLTYRITPGSEARGPLVPLGRPLTNTQVYILDRMMQPVPAGVAGEIYIGGDCVARGYLNKPELTADRFIPDTFGEEPGGRLYRTGDLARWLPTGEVEFLGRTDYQIKIRGFRIELGEIESALMQHEAVQRAVLIARDDGQGGKRLLGYVVPKRDASDSGIDHQKLAFQLREFLKERLPDYMIPSAIVVLEAMPLSAQGKIDLRSLPGPTTEVSPREGVKSPRTLLQAQLIEIWEELLNTSSIGIEDDFFELGGHSLLAVRMLAMMRKRFKRSVPLASLFRNSTVAKIAKLLEEEPQAAKSQVMVEIQPEGSGAPFFCVHPIGGSVFCYAELARALGRERPFYGLQAPAESPTGKPIASIEQTAALYLKEIQYVQPYGPYLLGGWSMGGLVALEMARQLAQIQQKVAMVALFDTYPPPPSRQSIEGHDELPIIARFAADMIRLMGQDPREMRETFLNLSEREQRMMLFESLKCHSVFADDDSIEEMDHLLSVFTRNSLAVEQYSPQPIEGRIVLFRAADADDSIDLAKQWSPWLNGAMELHSTPGDHYGILKRPNVTILAETLKQYFDDLRLENSSNLDSMSTGGL